MIPNFVLMLESGRNFPIEIHRVFGLDGNTFSGVIFILINVSLLAIVLSKLLYKPMLKMLDERADRIKSQLKHAEDEEKAAIDLKAQYEEKLKNIEAERNLILDSARKDATEKGKQILEEAKEEADAIRSRAMKNVEMENENAKEKMRQSIIELSSLMAEKFIARTIDTDMQDKLFTEVMSELNDADFKAADRSLA